MWIFSFPRNFVILQFMEKTSALSVERKPASRLFLLGFLTLFLELALIRYLAGNVWNLGFFPNLVLLGTFIGMGTGFVFHHFIGKNLSHWLFILSAFLLLILVLFVGYFPLSVPGFGRWQGNIGGELFFTSTPEKIESNLWYFVLWFVNVVFIFACISQQTAKLFSLFRPLKAYTLDIAGSCCGILSFIAISWLQLPVSLWFIIFFALLLFASQPGKYSSWLIIIPLVFVVILTKRQDQQLLYQKSETRKPDVIWSPYQKLEFVKGPNAIFVNGIMHQKMENDISFTLYPLPYKRRLSTGLAPYKQVLILGAGSGNDVAAALAYDAQHIDALEIDPAIARLGRQYHPLKPYADPRVTLTVTDGRAFLTQATQQYDLIIFALTDSLVKASPLAQLRLENYLFTLESTQKAFSLLSENGDLIFYNYYRTEWLQEKIRQMLVKGTGVDPEIIHKENDFVMFRVGKQDGPRSLQSSSNIAVDIPRDDWPFLYLQKRGIPTLYLVAMLALACLICLFLLPLHFLDKKLLGKNKKTGGLKIKLAFIFMGVAFLLLETKSIIQFGLLFGTTWHNTSLVFLAILLLVLAANWTAAIVKNHALLPIAFFLLLVSCFGSLFFPLSNLLYLESSFTRFVLASLITFAPIYFANLIFSIALREQEVPEHLFGWNLMGATLGGILEYTSMAFGYNALSLTVAICYTFVFILLLQSGFLKRKHSAAEKTRALSTQH